MTLSAFMWVILFYCVTVVYARFNCCFVRRGVLGLQFGEGLDHMGAPRWKLVLCLIAVFVIVYFSVWKGVKTSGKVQRHQLPANRHNLGFSLFTLASFTELLCSNF